jgi:hypothetical protein
LAAGMAPDRVRFEDEETQENENSGKEVELRCRKCRYVPFFFLDSPVLRSLVMPSWSRPAQQTYSVVL